MPGIISKKSKVKRGFTPGYTPIMHREPTEEAHIPLMQPDATFRYVTEKDFKWMIDNKKIDMPMPTQQPKEETPQSQK